MGTNYRKSGTGIRVALISVAFLTLMASQAASSILGPLKQEFPQSATSTIQLIYTIVPLITSFSGFLCGLTVKRKKQALLTGIALFTIGGVLMGTANNIGTLLTVRILSGIGTGILVPTLNGLISDLFPSRERGKLLGVTYACSGLGSVAISFMAGILAVKSWRLVSLLFLCGLLPFTMIWKSLPEITVKPQFRQYKVEVMQTEKWAWKRILVLTVVNLCLGCIYASTYANLSIWLSEMGVSADIIGFAVAMSPMGAALFVWTAPWFLERMAEKWISLCWILTGAMLVLLSSTRSPLLMGAAMLGMGMFGGSINTSLTCLASRYVERKNSVVFMSIVSGANTLGNFLCPYVFGGIGLLFADSSVPFIFESAACGAFIMAVVCLALLKGYEKGDI